MDDRLTALDRLLEVTTLLGADLAADLARRGLTESRVGLVWLLGLRGPTTQRDLAASLGSSPRNVTGLVDALVATGFVTREPHPTDRRAVLVTLTDRGARESEDLQRGHEGLAEELFGRLPAARVRALVADLDHVVARLRAALDGSGAGGA